MAAVRDCSQFPLTAWKYAGSGIEGNVLIMRYPYTADTRQGAPSDGMLFELKRLGRAQQPTTLK
jgi:hypothetical protein